MYVDLVPPTAAYMYVQYVQYVSQAAFSLIYFDFYDFVRLSQGSAFRLSQ
jgi:hypothetical protein